MKSLNFLFFLNSYYAENSSFDETNPPISGGDKKVVELLRYWKKHPAIGHTWVCTNQKGRTLVSHFPELSGLTTVEIRHPFEKIDSPSAQYLATTLLAPFFLLRFFFKKMVLYSGSDFLADVTPPLLLKILRPRSFWIANIFHQITKPSQREGNKYLNYLIYFQQKFCHFLIKHFANMVILDNEQLRQDLSHEHFDVKKMHTITLGANIEMIRTIPNPPSRDPGTPPQGCFLGRLTHSKGIYDLLEIVSLIRQEIPDFKLVIMGPSSSQIKHEYVKEIAKRGLTPTIQLRGFLPIEEVYTIMKQCEVFLFPSKEEGFGIVIAEAMACGLPVVAYDLPAYKDTFTHGIVKVHLGNTKAFAQKTIQVLLNGNLRIEMAKRAHKLSQSFSWEQVAKKELDLIIKKALTNHATIDS